MWAGGGTGSPATCYKVQVAFGRLPLQELSVSGCRHPATPLLLEGVEGRDEVQWCER
jgi:hypothetical protein